MGRKANSSARHNNAGPKFGIQLFDPAKVRAVEALSPDGELMTSLDLLHIPTPWHNCVVQLAGSETILVTKAKLARKALDAGSMTGGLAKTASGTAFFSLQRESRSSAAVASEPEVETEKNAAAAVAVGESETGGLAPVQEKLQRRTTLSEKADAVVAAVVRRTNTGANCSASAAPTNQYAHNTWLGRLRWLLSLFWPRAA